MDKIDANIFRKLGPGESGMKLGKLTLMTASIGTGKSTYGQKEKEMSFFGNWFEPLEGDQYGRSRFQEAWDRFAGVEEYQLRQRYGLNEIKVVEPEPYVRGWNDKVDDFCDMLLDRWGFCK